MSCWKQKFRDKGFTLPEVLLTLIMVVIVVAGLYNFLGRQTRKITEESSKGRLALKEKEVKEVILRELEYLGMNPRSTPFQIDFAPAGFRGCDTFPLNYPDNTDPANRNCFGITHAAYHKLGFSGDSFTGVGNQPGIVDMPEERAFVLQEANNPAVIYDPLLQPAASAPLPSYINKVDDANMHPPPPFPFQSAVANLELDPIPRLCKLDSGKFDQEYNLLLRTYNDDGSGNAVAQYRTLVDNVICFGVAYLRKPHDYELCQPCQAPTVIGPPPSGFQPMRNPAACNALPPPPPKPFPTDYFRDQVAGSDALMTNDEADKGYVFMHYPDLGGALNPQEAYNTRMIKLSLILKDPKPTLKGNSWTNPLTGTPHETVRVDLTYIIPEAHLPCDKDLGNCAFNNSQCD